MNARESSNDMRLRLSDLSELPDDFRRSHVVIGNFDGVHIGHQKVLERASKLARLDGGRVLAITFEPHPRTVLSSTRSLLQLTNVDEKVRLLTEAGADKVVSLVFDMDMAAMAPSAFVEDVLARRFQPRCIVTGGNFRFGRNRSGLVARLAELGREAGIAVEEIPLVTLPASAEPVSSTAIRSCLAVGDIAQANRLLGRRWTLEGTVVHGDHRGRELGFPTANIILGNESSIAFGIYAVRMLVDSRIQNGVASYGTRPQFDDGAPRLEIHLLDFKGDLYGKHIDVEFVGFQRPELKFADLDALLQQMNADCADARRLLHAENQRLGVKSIFESRAPSGALAN